jgi:hypothetical protein
MASSCGSTTVSSAYAKPGAKLAPKRLISSTSNTDAVRDGGSRGNSGSIVTLTLMAAAAAVDVAVLR